MKLDAKEWLGPAARPALLAVSLITVGSALLSVFEGWLAVVLWIVAVPIACIAVDVASRREPKRRPVARTRPAMVFRVTRRRRGRKPKASPPDRFVWRSADRPRTRVR